MLKQTFVNLWLYLWVKYENVMLYFDMCDSELIAFALYCYSNELNTKICVGFRKL